MMHDTPENPFRKFWDLGYRNLIPVVPPNAELSPHSNLSVAALGKSPGVLGRDGLWRGANLHRIYADESDLDHWFSWGAGVGMRGDENLFFVDVDHMDPAASKRLYKLAKTHLGASWPRVGRAPKFALPYRSTSLVASAAIKFDCDQVEGSEPGLDIISTTPHCVVAGTHVTTGEPYDWPKGTPAYADLTEVTPEQVTAFLAAVEAEFPVRSKSVPTTRELPKSQDSLRGDPAVLRSAMRDMPNTSAHFPHRENYIEMGLALKAGFGPDDEDEALALYHQWCGRWDGGVNDETRLEKDWARMKPPFSLGADYIYAKAESLTGWTRPAEAMKALGEQFFEPQEMEGDAEPQRQGGYQLMSVEDVMLMRPPQFLIDRHLPETGFGILYGDPGCGKSFIALDMALTLAYGLDDWHGDAIQPKGPKKVLYIAGEGASGFQSRIRAWQEMHKEQIQHRQCHAKFLFQSVNFMKPDDIRLLVTAAREVGSEWAMIVVDTVSRAIPGADENLQKDMTIFVHACDALKDAMGAFVLGVHHTAKTGTMRGSSVFLGQADVVLRLTRQKGASIGRLDCEKQKDAPDGWGDAYRLSVVEVGEMGSSLVPCRVDGGSAESGSVDVGLQNIMLRAADAAWKAGEPWSENARSGERFAPRVLSRDFGIAVDQASALLDIWLGQRILVSETVDKRSKKKGLKVAAFIAENADDLSGSEGVFE